MTFKEWIELHTGPIDWMSATHVEQIFGRSVFVRAPSLGPVYEQFFITGNTGLDDEQAAAFYHELCAAYAIVCS